MKEPNTLVSYTLETVPPGDTDWERLDAMTDEEVEAAALADPDAQPMTEEQLRRARWVDYSKGRPLVDIEPGVLAWFREHEGDDYRDRINEVLRNYVKRKTRRDAA